MRERLVGRRDVECLPAAAPDPLGQPCSVPASGPGADRAVKSSSPAISPLSSLAPITGAASARNGVDARASLALGRLPGKTRAERRRTS